MSSMFLIFKSGSIYLPLGRVLLSLYSFAAPSYLKALYTQSILNLQKLNIIQ